MPKVLIVSRPAPARTRHQEDSRPQDSGSWGAVNVALSADAALPDCLNYITVRLELFTKYDFSSKIIKIFLSNLIKATFKYS